MQSEEAQNLRAKIGELGERLARSEDEAVDEISRTLNLIVAQTQALEEAMIALAIEVREEINAPDLLNRVSLRLTHGAAPALRKLKNPSAARGADAVEGLASRLDQVPKPPKLGD